ncbi:AraC family transcriptional regulator [Bacillus sp. JCM 19034]|uniref:AraC family transcriptional regulator n=1 Tax=Bacillus sp. JCM 19034 TaxID=1481928 RepID=UPI000780920F|nr:AraC family transcriptional regulator [Bacillus sp. JCM 19034]
MVKSISLSQRERSFYIHTEPNGSPKAEMRTYHLHDDFEIYFLIEGARQYLVNDVRYPIKSQSLVFINRNIAHKTTNLNNTYHHRIVMNFRQSIIPANSLYLINILFRKSPTVVTLSDQDTALLYQLTRQIQNEYKHARSDSSLYIQTLLVQFLILSKRLYETQRGSIPAKDYNQPAEPLITRIMKYIHENIEKNLSLPQISQVFHISEHHLCRLFNKETGSTVVQYINAVRINEAKRLLLETSNLVKEISKKVGYSNHAHFCRVFKQQTGCSPSSFRYKQKGSYE